MKLIVFVRGIRSLFDIYQMCNMIVLELAGLRS